MCFVSPKKMK